MKVAVIGGGLGGLAAACTLARARLRGRRSSRRTPGSAARRRVLEEGGFRFDMGPTILTLPSRPASASSPRPAATSTTSSTSSASTRSGAASSTTARASTCIEDVDAMARRDRRASRPARARATGYRSFLALSAAPARHLRALLLLEADRRHRATCSTSKAASARRPSATSSRCAWAARSPARSAAGQPDAARRPDARPLHPVRRLVARRARRRCSAASPTCRRTRASGTRAAARAPCPRRWPSSPANSASSSAPATGRRRIDVDGRRASRASRPTPASASPLAAVVSNCDARADPPRAARRRPRPRPVRARRGYEPACSGVVLYLGLDRALRSPAPPQLRLLPRPARGVRLHLPQGRAGPRPDLLPRRPARHRPGVAPAGRRGALRPRPHPLPAPAPRLDDDASRPTAASSSTS